MEHFESFSDIHLYDRCVLNIPMNDVWYNMIRWDILLGVLWFHVKQMHLCISGSAHTQTHTTIYTHTDAYMQQTLIYRAVCIHHLLHDSFNDYIYLSVRGILSLSDAPCVSLSALVCRPGQASAPQCSQYNRRIYFRWYWPVSLRCDSSLVGQRELGRGTNMPKKRIVRYKS